MVEHLLSKHEALNSNPSNIKKTENNSVDGSSEADIPTLSHLIPTTCNNSPKLPSAPYKSRIHWLFSIPATRCHYYLPVNWTGHRALMDEVK
jgi:hypothetical protein